MEAIRDPFALTFDADRYRRIIAGKDVIIHCHHYNARIQRTIESPEAIDGKGIFVSACEGVFYEHVTQALGKSVEAERWDVAAALYRHLGFGVLDFSRRAEGTVTAPHSHFVEGWNAGFPDRDTPCCSLSEGFIQAAFAAVGDELVYARETDCMLLGAEACRFEILRGRTAPLTRLPRLTVTGRSGGAVDAYARSPNVDETKIVDALVAMPIVGGADGLIPAFNVYLANMPADIYNLACIRFLEAMDSVGLGSAARTQLSEDAEACGVNTFRGIVSSAEWDVLVGPMLQEEGDTLFGIIAVSNALGWGNWHVLDYDVGESVRLESLNGYEADGVLQFRGDSREPACLMLTGVAAGIMELIHGEGSVTERYGQFLSHEGQCRCCAAASCRVHVEEAE